METGYAFPCLSGSSIIRVLIIGAVRWVPVYDCDQIADTTGSSGPRYATLDLAGRSERGVSHCVNCADWAGSVAEGADKVPPCRHIYSHAK